MNKVIKFPDMRPPKSGSAPVTELPTPAQFRQTSSAIISNDPRLAIRGVGRRRLLLWFGLAVALHAALLLAIWLMPPLRLKWEPSADAWVQVISLPQEPPHAPPANAAAAQTPAVPKAGTRKAPPPVAPNPEKSN
jgi:hypothetical protein